MAGVGYDSNKRGLPAEQAETVYRVREGSEAHMAEQWLSYRTRRAEHRHGLDSKKSSDRIEEGSDTQAMTGAEHRNLIWQEL